MKVTELMNPHPVTVYGGDSVQKAAELMAQTGRGLLVVIDNIGDRKVIGVLSNKDIINKVIAKKISPTNRLVSEVMNREVVSIFLRRQPQMQWPL
jgi:CBS domain-containing protein